MTRFRSSASAVVVVVVTATTLVACTAGAAVNGVRHTARVRGLSGTAPKAAAGSSAGQIGTRVSVSPTEPPSPSCVATERLANDQDQSGLAQLLFIGISGPETAIQELRQPDPPGGVFLVGSDGSWLANGALKSLAMQATVPPIVAADEEGGRVTRISAEAGPMPSALAMSAMGPTTIESIAAKRGAELAALGINMDLAPDVDLYDRANAVINDRAFSFSPDIVVQDASAFISGLASDHVLAVLKHFPGHGRSSGDTHTQVASTPPWNEMLEADVVPFERLASQVQAIMVGHLDVPGLTEPGLPASISPAALNFLRDQLGFGGLAITDDLAMSAVTLRYSVAQAAVMALRAGEDMVAITLTYPNEEADVVSAIASALRNGSLSYSRVSSALQHIAAVKRYLYCGGHVESPSH